jgi:hypothetical protein
MTTVVEDEQARLLEQSCLMLFRRGENTCDIASRWFCEEGEIERIIWQALERRRETR